MRPIINLIGKRFGRLVVLKYSEKKLDGTMWQCICDCGTLKIISGHALRRKLTKSCGCLQKELLKKRSKTHGMWGSPEYNSWHDMHQRCDNPKRKYYKNYGGRGIKICKKWESFEQFYKDIGPRPDIKYTLERINNNGDYKPSNCRWATRAEQSSNMRNNIVFNIDNKTLTLSQISRKYNIHYETLRGRLRRGLTIKEALT